MPLGKGRHQILFKARKHARTHARTHTHHHKAVLVDMEESVVGELVKGPLGEVFDHQQLITDVSGSGNNWYNTRTQL